ncbi:MAG: hypothetical protein M1839_009128 [Geoglossum umbratile]|nr:MAG: hypothetical protein M1839_009128 [Geoglossum umbratile]
MIEVAYNELLLETTFKPRGQHSFIEAWEFQDLQTRSGPDVIKEGSLSEDSIEDWLHRRGKFKAPASHATGECLGGLRLIITEHADLWTCTYPFGKLTFLKIMEAMKPPLSFLQGSREMAGSCIRSIKHDDASGVASFIGVVIKVPQANTGYGRIGTYCLAISHELSTGITSGLLVGEWDGHFARLLTRIRASVSQSPHPVFLPVLFYDDYVWRMQNRRNALEDQVVDLECRIGVTFTGRLEHMKPKDKLEDYSVLTALAHTCITSAIFFDFAVEFRCRFSGFLMKTIDSIQDLAPLNRKDGLLQDARKLKEWVELDTDAAESHKTVSEVFQKRAQVQANVLYSLIAQRDSKLNASIARDSKRVASASKRDSSAMKTIAFLTVVFLPGTFIASIFSTSMFNFHADGSDQKPTVSKYIWIYWLLTTVLTLIVIAMWLVWMRQKIRRHREEDRLAEKLLQFDDLKPSEMELKKEA